MPKFPFRHARGVDELEVVGMRFAEQGPVVDEPPRARYDGASFAVPVVAVGLGTGMHPHGLVQRLVHPAVVLVEHILPHIHRVVPVLHEVLQTLDDVVDVLLAEDVVAGTVVGRGVRTRGDEEVRETGHLDARYARGSSPPFHCSARVRPPVPTMSIEVVNSSLKPVARTMTSAGTNSPSVVTTPSGVTSRNDARCKVT